ncbi:MAG: serine hydrolase [Clostridia bacterium]|nr:serine hydrolase [Clostridia bacterium]
MPTTLWKNLLYRAALPLSTPRVRHNMEHYASNDAVPLREVERILSRHHVIGSSLLISDAAEGNEWSVLSSVPSLGHVALQNTVFRVASITKTATALVILRLVQDGAFRLDDPVMPLLPLDDDVRPVMEGITVRHLLSHRSSLRDVPGIESILLAQGTLSDALRLPGIRVGMPDQTFSYCNFGFGLLGSLIEQVIGECVEDVFQKQLFQPLSMYASLSALSFPDEEIMPILRVLPYRPGTDVLRTTLGQIPLDKPDPERHFGYTQGSMYTDADSLSSMIQIISPPGEIHDSFFLRSDLIHEMKTVHSVYGRRSPTLSYGLGLLIIRDPRISSHRILGHQGFAYGCVDGAFTEEGTGRKMVFVNGGCSEARSGMLGLCNRDLLKLVYRDLPVSSPRSYRAVMGPASRPKKEAR